MVEAEQSGVEGATPGENAVPPENAAVPEDPGFFKPWNEKCDLWSCGAITYLILSGIHPFSGATH